MKKVLAFVLALCMVIGAGAAMADGAIKISTIGPLTGPYAAYGLAVANALCRRMVLDNERVDDRLRDDLFNAAYEDGRDYCQLERDEVEPIFDEAFNNMVRLFKDSRVRKAMDTFADALQQRRTLSHIDVIDILQQLNLV